MPSVLPYGGGCGGDGGGGDGCGEDGGDGGDALWTGVHETAVFDMSCRVPAIQRHTWLQHVNAH